MIDGYRDYPDYVAFANNLFRPYVGDRISIGYQDNSGDRITNDLFRAALEAEDQPVFLAELL